MISDESIELWDCAHSSSGKEAIAGTFVHAIIRQTLSARSKH